MGEHVVDIDDVGAQSFACHLLDAISVVHDEALPIVYVGGDIGDVLGLSDVLSISHKEMPTINYGIDLEDGVPIDSIVLSDVVVAITKQRYVVDLSDDLGLVDANVPRKNNQYSKNIAEILGLSMSIDMDISDRFYASLNAMLVLEDDIQAQLAYGMTNVIGLADEISHYHTYRHYRAFEDNISLQDEAILRHALFVTGGLGSGYYEHGESVPISVTLERDEHFLIWAGETDFVLGITERSTYVLMPNETVRIEAIKGVVSPRDIQALGGKVTAADLDIIMEQGSSFMRDILYRDPDGNPVDLTGWTAAMHVRKYKGAPTALLTLTSSAGYIVMAGEIGHLEIHIPANEMDDLDFVWGFYDLEVYPDGDAARAFRILEGRINLSKEVTI